MLGMLSGAVSISIFAIAVQVNMYYMQISTAASGVFLPRITAMHASGESSTRMSDAFIKVGRIQFAVIALALSGFILFGRQFITMWAGQNYTESFSVAIWLMIPLSIPLIQNLGITILQAKNKHAFRSVVYLVIAIINILISIPLIKKYGALGAAMGTSVSLVAGQVIIMNFYYSYVIELNIKGFWTEIAKMTPAVLLAVGAELLFARFVGGSGKFWFLINAVAFVGFYSIFMWLIGLNNYEKELVLAPIRNLSNRIKAKI